MLQSIELSPSGPDLCAAVERQAAATPEAAATITSEYSHSTTVSQLASSSAKCTKLLRAHGIGPGSLIAIEISEPGLPAAVGLLGVLGSGSSAVFLPSNTGCGQLPMPSIVSALLLPAEADQLADKGGDAHDEVGCR